ncbi:MAG: hypothetical protein JW912_01700 [Sedimentisphaerales bacterium]|nr:hypothetical protein [Sedimentisphaerales bacterium]
MKLADNIMDVRVVGRGISLQIPLGRFLLLLFKIGFALRMRRCSHGSN